MQNDKERLDAAKWLLERTLGWIATADVKVGAAVAIDTALVGGLAAAFAASSPDARTGWGLLLSIASIVGLTIAICCAALAAIPRMTGPVKSVIFFARIAEQSEPNYVDTFRKISESEFLEDVLKQVHRNAEIATTKHNWVRKSLNWSFYSGLLWLAAVIQLIKT